MARPTKGRTERRLALVILLTSMVPLAVAVLLVGSIFRQASAVWLNLEIGRELDRAAAVHKDYVEAVKDDMGHQTDAIAADGLLREAAGKRDSKLVETQLDVLFPRFPGLTALVVTDDAGRVLARRDRGRAVDRAEHSLEVQRPLGSAAGSGAHLAARFAVDRWRLDELETAGAVVTKYHRLEASHGEVYRGYLQVFAALLGITMAITGALGVVLARGVTRRLERLAHAFTKVAMGDLSVRVPVTGSDELTELASGFNTMLGELEESRARIEYLQRIGTWQEMARLLAHEIKNPLTPILLAVQECHRKYPGEDAGYRALLDTTREIVEEEVGTLRRLVGAFSSFARMPQAELVEADLRHFVRECEQTLGHLESEATGDPDAEPAGLDGLDGLVGVDVTWNVPDRALPAAIDRQMLRRVLANLVRNAVQAVRAARPHGKGAVCVSARPDGDGTAIVVEDDGPGVAEGLRARIFDPYFTLKEGGTGLGLAIVKKIVVEHGGRIEVDTSPSLGGARFTVHLPRVPSRALAA